MFIRKYNRNDIKMTQIKLIYHKKSDSESPFDRVINEMVQNAKVYVVCPYIDIRYLTSIAKLAKELYLITDVEEWIKSSDKIDRQKIENFIRNNISKIRHCKNIHAKVLITEEKCFITSSNLTIKGLTRNIEMGILLENHTLVEEAQSWFLDLWYKSVEIEPQKLENFISEINLKQHHTVEKLEDKLENRLSQNNKIIRSKLVTKIYDISYERLLTSIRKIYKYSPEIRWIEDFFDLAKELVEFAQLDSNDPRLVTSIRKDGYIAITIGRRYVLCPVYAQVSKKKYPNYRQEFTVGLIMPLEYEPVGDSDNVVYTGYFSENKENIAKWVVFYRKNRINFSDHIKDLWKKAVIAELKRCKISPYRKFHEPLVYEAIVNQSFRNKVLRDAII